MIFHVVQNGKIGDGGFDDDDDEEDEDEDKDEDEDEDDNVRDAHKGQLTVLLTISYFNRHSSLHLGPLLLTCLTLIPA